MKRLLTSISALLIALAGSGGDNSSRSGSWRDTLRESQGIFKPAMTSHVQPSGQATFTAVGRSA